MTTGLRGCGRTPGLVLTALSVACATLLLPTVTPAESDPLAGDQIVFLVQYIGSDYANAVRAGTIANAFEFEEVLGFADVALESCRAAGGAVSESTLALLEDLRDTIAVRGAESEVRRLSAELTERLTEAFGVSANPAERPDLERGAALYASDCAVCHGSEGSGDGRAAPGMTPPPTSFRDPAVNRLTPYQVFHAIRLGIPGTAMPSYRGAFDEQEAWDVAFHVFTLREGFRPVEPAPPLDLDFLELARMSNAQLLARQGGAGSPPRIEHVDYYRLHPGSVRLLAPAAPARPALTTAAPLGSEVPSGLDVAVRLEEAFRAVSAAVSPSLVGITAYERDAGASTAAPGPVARGWTGSAEDLARYEGHRVVRVGSGFVFGDRFVVTRAGAVQDSSGQRPADLVDVEFASDRHELARLVASEPTVDLAFLELPPGTEMPPALTPVPAPLEPGQWVLALGDPPGSERTFAVGIVAASPQRACYQESRTATLLQTSLRVGAESLGGPLVDIRGRVAAVSTPPDALAMGGADTAPAFGVPIELVRTLFEPMREQASHHSPWIGIAVLDLSWRLRREMRNPPRTGVYIDAVFEPSPASRAGIRVGDVLETIEGRRVLAVRDFQTALYLAGIGSSLELRMARDGSTFVVEVPVERRPPEAAPR